MKRCLHSTKTSNFRKGILPLVVIFGMLGVTILFGDCWAGLLGRSLPKGKEIDDPYLAQLFAPEFPYESIKVIETQEGKTYVIVKAKKRITEEEQAFYERNTLRRRGIFIRRAWSPRSGDLMLARMHLYRQVSEMPLVLEYWEVIADKVRPLLASPSEDVVRREGRHLVVFVSRDFSRPGTMLEVYPEKDADCPDPPFVGRYPNARKVGCREKDGKILFLLVTKDAPEAVYAFYKDRLLAHYDEVGVDYPERRWRYGVAGFGIQKRPLDIGYLEADLRLPKRITRVPASISKNGFVPNIVIFQLMPEPVVGGYCAIEIWYTVDPDLARSEKQRYPKAGK